MKINSFVTDLFCHNNKKKEEIENVYNLAHV